MLLWSKVMNMKSVRTELLTVHVDVHKHVNNNNYIIKNDDYNQFLCVTPYRHITLVHMYTGIAGSLNFYSLYINILAVKLTFRYSFFTFICEHCLCVWSLWCWTRNTMFLVSRSWLTFETRLSARLTMSLLASSVIILTSSWTSSQRLASRHVCVVGLYCRH